MRTYVLKLVMTGEGAVGKTTLVNHLVKRLDTATKGIIDYKMTIGTDFMQKVIYYDDVKANLQIWDFGGQKRFESIRADLYKGVAALFYVFDLTRPDTLYKLPNWFKEHINNNKDHEETVAMIIGNKSDLKDLIAVNDDEVIDLINENPKANIINYIKTSALEGWRVEEAFTELTKATVNRIDELEE